MPKEPEEPTRRLSRAELERTRRLSDADLDRTQRLADARADRIRRLADERRERKRHLSKTIDSARAPKKRHRKHRNWNRILRRVCAVALLAEAGWALFFNPYLRVTKVRVEGAQTVTPAQVFADARVPNAANIFWMALRQPFVKRLDSDPVVDHAARRIQLPDTLILRVWERKPFATLAAGSQFWLLDAHGVPYRTLEAPYPGLPLISVHDGAVQGVPVTAASVVLGKPLGGDWLRQMYTLIALLARHPKLEPTKIVVDKNANLGLNRSDSLQILLGQPEALAQKVALAQAAVTADGGDLARRAAYIDVSSPDQPVWKPRAEAQND